MTADFTTARGGAAQGPGGTAGPCGAPEQEKESRPRKRAVETILRLSVMELSTTIGIYTFIAENCISATDGTVLPLTPFSSIDGDYDF